MAGSAGRLEWRALDPADWRPVERFAGSISTVPNVPSPVPAVATLRVAGAHPPAALRRPARPRQARSDRRVHRRHVHRGEKGGSAIGPTKRGKGSKVMAICDGHGLPLAVYVASASPAEVRLVEDTLDARFFQDFPPRLIGDKAYDSDRLDATLMRTWGIEVIARHRSSRKVATQDGRPLRRAKRRWKIERLFAWFHNSRRLVVRWNITWRTILDSSISPAR